MFFSKKLNKSPDDLIIKKLCNLINYICNKYNYTYNNLKPRIIRTLMKAFLNPNLPLTTHYGAIITLSSFGLNVIESFILPYIDTYINLLKPLLDDDYDSNQEDIKIQHFFCYILFSCITYSCWIYIRRIDENHQILQEKLDIIHNQILDKHKDLKKVGKNVKINKDNMNKMK